MKTIKGVLAILLTLLLLNAMFLIPGFAAPDIFPSGKITLIVNETKTDVFKKAIELYGSPLRFESDGKITVLNDGTVVYSYDYEEPEYTSALNLNIHFSFGTAHVTAYDAATGAQAGQIDVRVRLPWQQRMLIAIGLMLGGFIVLPLLLIMKIT